MTAERAGRSLTSPSDRFIQYDRACALALAVYATPRRSLVLARVGDALLPFLEKPFDLDIVLDVVKTATEADERRAIGG